MKKSYTATFKAQVVRELLKEIKTLNQRASKYALAPMVLREWRQAARKGLPDVFTKGDSVTDLKATHERQLEDLSAEIGRLTTHVNFLKKSYRLEPRRAARRGRARSGCPAAHDPGRPARDQPPQFVLSARTATAGGSGDHASYR